LVSTHRVADPPIPERVPDAARLTVAIEERSLHTVPRGLGLSERARFIGRTEGGANDFPRRASLIVRIWRGWTTPENADPYEQLLRTEIFPGIEAKGVSGFRGIRLLRRALDSQVEFMTIMEFDDLDAVREFAGPDYETAYVPRAAREVLARFDLASSHYEIRIDAPTPDAPPSAER